jgi:hypothetical protein
LFLLLHIEFPLLPSFYLPSLAFRPLSLLFLLVVNRHSLTEFHFASSPLFLSLSYSLPIPLPLQLS